MELKFVNKIGKELVLTNNPYFYLADVNGQTAATANISSLTIGGIDGDIINNVQAQPREIVFDFLIKKDANVETAKREILNIIKLKQKASIFWTQNNKVVKIDGIVESVEMPRWNDRVTMQVSMHCEQPFWEDINDLVQQINEEKPLHYFTDYQNDMLYFLDEGIPFGEYDYSRSRQISNAGDTDIGMTIEILALDTVTNPVITNQDGKFFGIGYGNGAKKVVMQAGEKIVINTVKGQKSVKKGNQNLYGYIKPQSTWLQLDAGLNTLAINSDDESNQNMIFSLLYKQRYI